MSKNVIASMDAPKAIGPYSQAIQASGDILFISGQLPVDPGTGLLVADDIVLQTRQSLDNIMAILKEAGMGKEHVVKTTVLLKDIREFKAMNEVYGEYFSTAYPARVAFQVASLPMDARVEIEAVAISG